MYVPKIGKLTTYPIPTLRLPPGDGRTFVELGCGWGRWCIAAARAGYIPIGIDPMLGAVRAARRVAAQLGVTAHFITGDARYLPLRAETADVVFSYSVLQHLAPTAVADVLSDVRRVLTPDGRFFAQFANALGARSLLVQARRGFRTATGFEVRYWPLRTLRELAESRIGPTTIDVDGFFSVNAQPADIPLLPARYRLLVRVSEAIRSLTTRAPWLVQIADSVYVSSARPSA
jgi:SAM-dependent methyltransferase